MTIQQLKDRINGWFRQKSPVERQKMMKYAVVIPAAIISGIVIIWLIFGSSQSSNLLGNAFNTELPLTVFLRFIDNHSLLTAIAGAEILRRQFV